MLCFHCAHSCVSVAQKQTPHNIPSAISQLDAPGHSLFSPLTIHAFPLGGNTAYVPGSGISTDATQ